MSSSNSSHAAAAAATAISSNTTTTSSSVNNADATNHHNALAAAAAAAGAITNTSYTTTGGDGTIAGGGVAVAGTAAAQTQQQQSQQPPPPPPPPPQLTTDQRVMEYLHQKGLTVAALHLKNIVKQEQQAGVAAVAARRIPGGNNNNNSNNNSSNNGHLNGGSGGGSNNAGFMINTNHPSNYAAAFVQSQLQQQSPQKEEKTLRERIEEEDETNRAYRTLLSKSTGGGLGYDGDGAWPVVQWGAGGSSSLQADATVTKGRASFKDEKIEGGGSEKNAADAAAASNKQPRLSKQKLGEEESRASLEAFTDLQLWVWSLPEHDGLQRVENSLQRAHERLKKRQEEEGEADDKKVDFLSSIIKELTTPPQRIMSNKNRSCGVVQFHLPPSIKAELMAVAFAAFVHTYCEMLEHGTEAAACALRDAFRPVYEPLYPTEYRDLLTCNNTEQMMRLNTHNSQHIEAVNSLKSIMVQVASYQLRREELHAQIATMKMEPSQLKAREAKIKEYDHNVVLLKNKYKELSQRASLAFDKMIDLPFLRRARAVRWQITLSHQSYGALVEFVNGGVSRTTSQAAMLALSTLLQTRMILKVERRNPLPMTPSFVLEDCSLGGDLSSKLKQQLQQSSFNGVNDLLINWSAPAPENQMDEMLSFPKYNTEQDSTSQTRAQRDEKAVSFKRALVVNGFRRLESLERKRNYDSLSTTSQKKLKQDGPEKQVFATSKGANPLEPTILLTTLCGSNSTRGPYLRPSVGAGGSATANASTNDASSIWEESGVGLCCAKICPPGGSRVAVGCDDSAVRVWDMGKSHNLPLGGGGDAGEEPCQVLLGHKNGFPVFDLSWNRDGRSLLSAGGDGSIRLWDTQSVGQSGSDSSGEALAVYRGHVPTTPVWSVEFSPCGYFFASAGADGSARLWTTDRSTPVRLFTGHTSSNVNSVTWHPNANYILTGCGDKTVRLWDIQTGRTVRLFTGCSAGVHAVRVSPGGRYAAAADYMGTVHMWSMGTGKKVFAFRTPQTTTNTSGLSMVHSLAFSACGSTLAVGGDDGCVRVWDTQTEALTDTIQSSPTHVYPTRRTMLMDLQYTKRNLLLAVGKSITPVPLVTPSGVY